jgi:hypothetical protein
MLTRAHNSQLNDPVAYHREYYLMNKEAIAERKRKHRQANREVMCERDKERYKRDKGYLISHVIWRRAHIANRATPRWANLSAIRDFYANCPEGHHVDHIVPIKGKAVSGLHVIENLQYLPASENQRKSNKYHHDRL